MAIYVSGDIIPVHDASGVTAWAAGNNLVYGVWTYVSNSGTQSSDWSSAVNTGEWWNVQIIMVHNDSNNKYEIEWWLASGDHYGATASQMSRTGDVSVISDPTFSTSASVKTVTFGMTGITEGSVLRSYMMRLQ
jgi:hypothetical protein